MGALSAQGADHEDRKAIARLADARCVSSFSPGRHTLRRTIERALHQLAGFPIRRCHTGYNPYEHIVLSPNNVASLSVLWADGYPSENASPVLANGVVYFATVANLSPLDATTGAPIWTYPESSYSTPAVANGVVYSGSTDGNLYALNAGTGELLWKYKTGAYVDSPPVVANGVVYAASGDGNLYALNASTGALVWKYAPASQYGVDSSPAVVNGVVYFGAGGTVYALNAGTGVLIWSYSTKSGYRPSSAAVVNGVVYIGSPDGNVYALKADTGALVWKYREWTGGWFFTGGSQGRGVCHVLRQQHLCSGCRHWSVALEVRSW